MYLRKENVKGPQGSSSASCYHRQLCNSYLVQDCLLYPSVLLRKQMEEIKGITNTVVSCNKTFQYSSRRKKKSNQNQVLLCLTEENFLFWLYALSKRVKWETEVPLTHCKSLSHTLLPVLQRKDKLLGNQTVHQGGKKKKKKTQRKTSGNPADSIHVVQTPLEISFYRYQRCT